MPKRINVRVAAGRLIIQRGADDPKRKEGEFRPMDRTDEECKAAWRGAVEGGQPPKDGLYVVTTVDGAWGLFAVTEHRDPETDLTAAEEAAQTEELVEQAREQADEAEEGAEEGKDQVEVGEQAAELDEAEATAAREGGAEPEPADDPRELAGDKGSPADDPLGPRNPPRPDHPTEVA